MRIYEFKSRVLLEYSREITAKNFGAKLLAVAQKDNSFFSNIDVSMDPHYNINPADIPIDFVLDCLEEADPTKNKQYVATLAKWYVQGNVKFEDLESRGTDALIKFDELKRRNLIDASLRDIGKYKTFQQFENTMGQIELPAPAIIDKGISRLYDDTELRIITPIDQQAAMYYGQGTKWCTAATNGNMFARYAKEGPLYIIMPKNPSHPGEKWQIHFESRSYMNEEDKPVSIYNLAERYPQLRAVFKDSATKFKILGLLYANIPQETVEELESTLVDTMVKNNFGLVVYQSALEAFRTLFKEGWFYQLIMKQPQAFEIVRGKLLALVNDKSTVSILFAVGKRVNIMSALLMKNDGFGEIQDDLFDVVGDFMHLSNGLASALEYLTRFYPADTDDGMEASMIIEHEMALNLAKAINKEADKVIKFNLDQYRVQ